MVANELRIGNLVNDEFNRVEEIWAIDKYKVQLCSGAMYIKVIKDLKPIPLTEEWLLKFGFEKTDTNEFISPFDRKRLVIRFNDNGPGQINTYWIEDVGMGEASLTFDIKYVHELQNLWFALKGNELTLTS